MKGTFLCAGTMKTAQKGVLLLYCHGNLMVVDGPFLRATVKQGQGIQLAPMSFTDIVFKMLLICNGGFKLLLMMTQLSHT